MKDIYNDSTYLQKNPSWGSEDSPFKAGKIIELLKRNPDVPHKTVCEVGCGSGEVLVQLSSGLKDVTHFYGFDISKDAMSIAKQKETATLTFELKDFTQSKDNNSYDLILVLDVIEHVEDYFKFLRSIAAKSRYTIFQIPLDICVWTLFRENILLESKERVGHIHNFTEDVILSILADNGFRILDKMYLEPIFECKTFKQKIVRLIHRVLFRIAPRSCSKIMGSCTINVLTENTSNALKNE